ncbi:Voltage-gated ion channel, partial [Globisporangium splendens]
MVGNNHRVSPEVTLKNPNTESLTPKLPIRMGTNRSFTAKRLGNGANGGNGTRVAAMIARAANGLQLSPEQFKKMNPARKKLLAVLDSQWFTIAMLVVTVYALFGDDIRLSLFTRGADNAFYSLAVVRLVLFAFEFFASCYCKFGYLLSFYFALDLIATFSVLPDIGWIWNEIIGTNGGSSSATKASKATLAGSKAGRIILKWKHKDEDHVTTQLKESKVGSKMGEATVRRVVILVLFLIVLLPVFDGGCNEEEYRYQDYGLRAIHMTVSSGVTSVTSVEYARLFVGYVRDAGMLVYLHMTNVSNSDLDTAIENVRFQPESSLWSNYTLTENPSNEWTTTNMLPDYASVLAKLRGTEVNIVKSYGCYNESFITVDTPDSTSACISIAISDISSTTQSSAGYNILETFFIITMLVAASTSFVRTARILVLDPIERMMNIVQKLAENLLASVQQTAGDNQQQAQIRKNAKEQGFETALLEITLSKIGTLMQVGFDAAGADIVGKNMGSGELDPMLPGKTITAIYGFCDIRQFTDTTECLQEEVMVHVNKLGNTMHSGTHHYYGMANKNVGDASLLSWKICGGEMPCFARFTDCPTEDDRVQVNLGVTCPPNAGAGTKQRCITPTEMADSALTAFIKCMIALDNANTDGPLTEYLKNDAVVKRFGPNFRIKMGFGMHVGWAVEGAIGSRYKIDATYISPHVEMADRLEAGSKIFMTPINISHWLAALLSPGARKFLRKMDRISVRGVDTPVTVYTFDVTVMKKGFATSKIDPSTGIQQPVDFENDPEYMEIREGLEPAFLESAASAVDAYLAGTGPRRATTSRTHSRSARRMAVQDGKGYHYLAGY